MTTLSATYPNALRNRQWFRLDNAGKLYPAVSTAKWCSTFRVAVVMKREVDPDILQEAVDMVLPRFISMKTQLLTGAFWYYLEENPKRLFIQAEQNTIWGSIHWRKKQMHLFKVLYDGRRISAEFFHALTDGTGAMVFLKTLIAEYLRLCGMEVPCEEGVLDPRSMPKLSELEDAFQKMPLPKTKGRIIDGPAYRFPGKRVNTPYARRFTAFCMPLSELKDQAKSMGVTITEYLAAAILYVGCQEQLKSKPKKMLPVRVSVPVNMRQVFPTESLRNCSWFVNPEISPPFDDISFESIVAQVQVFMQEALLPENLYAGIAPNVASEKGLLRIAPLPLKNLVIRSVHNAMGTKSVTATLSNLGCFRAPAEMMAQLERAEFMLGPAKGAETNAAVITTGDSLRLTFTSNQEEPVLPNEFERLLTEQGIALTKEVVRG